MKPTFSVQFIGNGKAPCEVLFTSTPQSKDEEIRIFDFKDGVLYYCLDGERAVRHTYTKAGTYGVTAIAVDRKTASDPVSVVIRDGTTETEESFLDKLIAAMKAWWHAIFG